MNLLTELWDNYKYYRKIKKTSPKVEEFYGFLTSDLHSKYPKGHSFSGRKVLNVGCGKGVFPASNVVNLDIYEGQGVNVVWDLSKTPIPFESNSFDLVIANHVLEHVPNWFECFKELARVVNVGGAIEIWVPPVSSDSAFSYRDHINIIGDNSFAGCKSFDRSGTNLSASKEMKTAGDVSKLTITHRYIKMAIKWWITLAPQFMKAWMVDYLRNTVSEMGYIFIKGE